MFYSQRLQYFLERCHAHAHEMENRSLSNRFSTFFIDSAVYERRKECFLLRDRSGTTTTEVQLLTTTTLVSHNVGVFVAR